MSDIDLLQSDIDEDLRSSVRALLADRAPAHEVARVYDDPHFDLQAVDDGVFDELELAGLVIPEADGGDGAGLSAAGTVAGELGRAAAPSLFLSSAVIASRVVFRAAAAERRTGADGPAHKLLRRLAAEETTAVLAIDLTASKWTGPLHVSANPAGPTVADDPLEPGRTVELIGIVHGVADAHRSDLLIVPARTVGGALVIAVANASDAQIATFPSLDETRRLSEVKLAGIRGRVIAVGDGAQRALERALLDSLAVLACEQSGIVDAAFDLALDYVKERRQFGRTIGSFQAIKHRLAEAWIVGNQLRAAALSAVRSVDAADAGTLSRTDAAIAVRTASAYAKAHTSRIVEEALQFHGGNGMTWEFPIHLLLKRAKLDEVMIGGADAQRDELGRLVRL